MLKTGLGFAAACSMAASPCLAADFAGFDQTGGRRSGAGVGAYVAVPFGGPRSGRTQAGLRLTVSHDYRDATAQTAPVIRSDAFELRLIGDREPTLYMAGRPVTGEQAERANLTGVGTLVTVVVVAAAVVGGIVIWNAIDDSGEE